MVQERQGSPKCPHCRAACDARDLRANPALKDLVSKLLAVRSALICDLAALPQLRTELEQLHAEQQQPQPKRRPSKRRRNEQAAPSEDQPQRVTRSGSKRSRHSVRGNSEPASPAQPLSQEESQEWEPSESSPSPAKRRRRSSSGSGAHVSNGSASPMEASPSEEPNTAIGSNHAEPHSMQNGSSSAPSKSAAASQAGPSKASKPHFLDCPVCHKQVHILLSKSIHVWLMSAYDMLMMIEL